MVKLKVNGMERTFDGDSAMPLLWYLRDELRLTGTKFGCGDGAVRRLHGSQGRQGHARLHHADVRRRRRGNHHDRRPGRERIAPRAESLDAASTCRSAGIASPGR